MSADVEKAAEVTLRPPDGIGQPTTESESIQIIDGQEGNSSVLADLEHLNEEVIVRICLRIFFFLSNCYY